MNQIDAMRIFVRVAELASFTQAADSLGLPKASVSGTIKQLEANLGTRLLQRTTRTVQMTQDGTVFFERSKDMLSDMEELQTMFRQSEVEIGGRLRVDMSAGIAKILVIPRLPEFMRAHPGIDLELSCTDRRVDVIREGFDCVVRVGTLLDSTLIARPLGQFRLLNCVSPGYVEQFGVPQNLDALDNHKMVHYAPTFGGTVSAFDYMIGQQPYQKQVPAAIVVNNADAYQAACLAGMGIIQAPELGVSELIRDGKLVEILPDYRAAPMPVSLLYANRRHLPKRVQVFMNWVAGLFEYID
jgi:DNA-binding transcriptional LysR family regulator